MSTLGIAGGGWGAIPTLAWIGLIVTPFIVAVGQVLFKLAGDRMVAVSASGLMGTAIDPYMIAALGIYALGTVLWVVTLKFVPLTVAHPFMALTFVIVPLFSWWTLGEAVDFRYVFGLTLILAGLAVIVAR